MNAGKGEYLVNFAKKDQILLLGFCFSIHELTSSKFKSVRFEISFEDSFLLNTVLLLENKIPKVFDMIKGTQPKLRPSFNTFSFGVRVKFF